MQTAVLFEMPRFCVVCKKEKPVTDFYIRSNDANKPRNMCKKCSKEAVLHWRQTHREQSRKSSRTWHMMNLYGLSLEAIDAIAQTQENKCAICRCELVFWPVKKGAHIDHDHDTGKVRGILCHMCNLGIGFFKDNARSLNAAAAYLRKHGR